MGDERVGLDVARSYADAWLTNDTDTVLATFVSEPVLSPSGLPYLEGQDAACDHSQENTGWPVAHHASHLGSSFVAAPVAD